MSRINELIEEATRLNTVWHDVLWNDGLSLEDREQMKRSFYIERQAFDKQLESLISIERWSQRDMYDKPVSIIRMGDFTWCMVHHSSKNQNKERATIYAGRGMFIRYESYSPDDDCQYTTCKIGGYEMAWGDGDLATPVCPEGKPDISPILSRLGLNFDTFLGVVLLTIKDDPALWEHK